MREVDSDRSQALAAAITRNQARTASFQQYVERSLDLARIALHHTIDTYADVATGSGEPVKLRDHTLKQPPIAAVTLQQGNRVVASSIEGAPQLSAQDLRQSMTDFRPGRPAVGRPVAFRSSILIPISQPYPRGSPIAVAIVWIEPRRFTDMVDQHQFGERDLISLVGLDGVTRARRTGNRLSSGEDLSGKLVMARQRADPNGTYVGPSAIDGISRIFSHRRLTGYPLFVTSGVAPRDVLAPVNARRTTSLLMAAALSVAIFLMALVVQEYFARRQLRLALVEEANRRLLDAQEIARIGDWKYIRATGELFWSEPLRKMYRRKEWEAVMKLSDGAVYVTEADGERIASIFKRVMTTGIGETYEYVAQLPGGEQSYRHVVASPLRNDSGDIVGLHGTDQDITERKRIEALEKQLMNSRRADAMNALAATLAHELNQPLSAASNYLSVAKRILSRSPTSDPRATEVILSAIEQIKDTGEIIRAARELVSSERSALTEASLTRALEEAVGILDSVKRGPEALVENDLDPELDCVLARGTQLRQVFLILFKNAVEAVDPTQRPHIRVSSRKLPEALVEIQVSDNGKGLSGLDSDPFSALVSTKTAGLGLGLSLARTIIDAHGGRIEVLETSERGTTVGFTLKVADPMSCRA